MRDMVRATSVVNFFLSGTCSIRNVSVGIFCELQKAHELQQAGKGDITVEQLLTTSRHYRAIIHVCVMELQRERAGAYLLKSDLV